MSIAKSSFIVSIFTVLGLGLGFLSNMVIAMKFGARTDMDVFLAATTLPFFIINILSSSLNFTFIPVFAEYREKDSEEIWKVVSSFINLNIIATLVLCLIGIIFAYPIVKITTPGFTEEKLVKSAELLRLLFPIIIFTVVNELMASVYYSNKRFIVPSLNKVISPIVTMIYVFLFHNTLSTKSLAFATLTTAFLQAAILAAGFVKKDDFHYRFVFDYTNPGVIRIVKLMAPLVLGMLIYRAVPVFDRYFLSGLPEGNISHIGYAMKLISLIPTIIVSGISVSIFPVMAKYAAENDMGTLRNIMSKGIRMFFFLSFPITVFLGVLGTPVIRFVFERGAFVHTDTIAVYHAFALYLLALPATAMGNIVGQGYYVLKDTRMAAILGVAEMILYVLLCFVMLPFAGYLALPIAYATYLNLGTFINGLVVRYKLGNKGGFAILSSMFKHFVSATVPLLGALALHGSHLGEIAGLTLILVCFLVYFLISKFIFSTDEAVGLYNQIMLSFRKIMLVKRPVIG